MIRFAGACVSLLLLSSCDAFLPSVNLGIPSSVGWQSSTRSPTLNSRLCVTTEPTIETSTITSPGTPTNHYDALIVGGGPAGLLTAIMLSQKHPHHRIGVCERRTTPPPSPTDEAVWNDVARFYLLGIGFRGQAALQQMGVMDDFEAASVAVRGRRDWAPGVSGVEDGRITLANKTVTSRVLARDKLVGVLHHHILQRYNDSGIELLYGYDVEPLFEEGGGEAGRVSLRISQCEDVGEGAYAASQESEELCDAESLVTATTNFLIGADGSARTVANAMEQIERSHRQSLSPLQRLFSPQPFSVTRYPDDNPRVFKSVPIALPKDWPGDLNYSARSTNSSRITLEALPSDANGNLCALLLMNPDDPLAKPNVDPQTMREYFNTEFPQFSPLIPNNEMERLSEKPASTLPAFRYSGPRLHHGDATLVLGDAAHTVKPYYGLGANTALEDVVILSQCLDDSQNNISQTIRLFSDKRAADSEALVSMSRRMDHTKGKFRFITNFLGPLILDGIFHKALPKIFAPNMFAMFGKPGIRFMEIRKRKRRDRALQLFIIGSALTGLMVATKTSIDMVSRRLGIPQRIVTGVFALVIINFNVLKQMVAKMTQKPVVEN